MTKKEILDFNIMYEALLEITSYQSPEVLQSDSKKDWGLEYEESLEMAYENMQSTAKYAIRNIKPIII